MRKKRDEMQVRKIAELSRYFFISTFDGHLTIATVWLPCCLILSSLIFEERIKVSVIFERISRRSRTNCLSVTKFAGYAPILQEPRLPKNSNRHSLRDFENESCNDSAWTIRNNRDNIMKTSCDIRTSSTFTVARILAIVYFECDRIRGKQKVLVFRSTRQFSDTFENPKRVQFSEISDILILIWPHMLCTRQAPS